mmetsp:Transcript_46431/g.104346  ORF Transcript_46431/g.104346 Transcript_46431/m.104346 type:complete len:169 (-) Transcript_46431:119-625(-)|eukprot:CAMPEP_0197873552 /NCGR_PEP_ID=MMETSP1439-20131203/3331_1 /TAXON_ID=66791 /ORGANISM="Gonyaulax spinifera, Strain CCMP409" /LENGTH=168 /DNA_ID=CAMNT_0043492615 /DNA_START=89 /DNA_END=595 /DNA_ORIENTATION=-
MAEEEEGSWDTTIEEWLISEGFCCAGALAQTTDGAFYAAAPVADEAGWAIVFKEDHEETILNDDMSEKKMTINEASTLLSSVNDLKAPNGGLWLGGLKYTITQTESAFESGDYTFKTIFANRPKKGVHIAVTTSSIVAGFYDEEKGQTTGNCKKAVLAFSEYLMGLGY